MDNIPDVILYGEGPGFFGLALSSAGDVNGDGYDDVIIGAEEFNSLQGKAYLFYGDPSMDNIPDLLLTGDPSIKIFGNATSGGDINNDGYSDLVIGARGNNSNGRVYVYYGGPVGDNIADVILDGENNNDYFGRSVSCAKDINGDGYTDIIVGAPGFPSPTDKGKAYVYYGGINMNNVPDITFLGELNNSFFGYSVSSARDVNGDGHSDILIGAPNYNSNTGRAYLFISCATFCNITGPGSILVNAANVLYTGSTPIGYWTISNYGNTHASIASGSEW